MDFMSEPGRPYYNLTSKSVALPVFDTRIKVVDMQQAIDKYMLDRNNMLIANKLKDHQSDNRLFMLPAETRNNIYKHIMVDGHDWVPRSGGLQVPLDPRSNVMRLCKQITLEAMTLMEDKATVYVPIMGTMNFKLVTNAIIKHGIACLPPTQSTIMHALTTFRNVNIRLHTRHSRSNDPSDEEPYIDPMTCNILGSFRQALRIFTCSTSHFLGPAAGETTIKRRCTVHFDHVHSDWRQMVRVVDPFRFRNLASIMGQDRDTEWDIRYFVYATGEKSDDYWDELDPILVAEYYSFQVECDRYPNVKLVAEVYGEQKWSLEGKKDNVVRTTTPSSLLWPSWPEDAPSRMRKVDKEMDGVVEAVELDEDKSGATVLSEVSVAEAKMIMINA
ncbi:hypothetical protein J1614_004097 [Plenodomus biglobosus]|nr:hypothetical protein J1614_004097 [Plenodomus biglobosus]